MHFTFGLLAGLLTAALFALVWTARYVQSDVEHFTRWLDRTEGTA